MPTTSSRAQALPASASAEQLWQHALNMWTTSTHWRQQWEALKKLVELDQKYFPGRFLPIACELLRRELPHNICWLKTVAKYGVTGLTSPEQATLLWDSWEHSRHRLFLRKWPDDNQFAWHLRALSGIDQRWFPGRLRPLLFALLEQSYSARSSVCYDWYLFHAIQNYMHHDTDEPEIWLQWSHQWQKLFCQVPPDTSSAFFALESLLYLDEFHIPGSARPFLCQWLHTFPHTTLPPWRLSRALRRYTLQVAREGHDELAEAWKAYFEHSPSHSPLAFQTLKRLRSRVKPETWLTIHSVLTSPAGTSPPTSPELPAPAPRKTNHISRGIV